MDNLKKIKGEIYFRITVIEYFNLIAFIRMYLFCADRNRISRKYRPDNSTHFLFLIKKGNSL